MVRVIFIKIHKDIPHYFTHLLTYFLLTLLLTIKLEIFIYYLFDLFNLYVMGI